MAILAAIMRAFGHTATAPAATTPPQPTSGQVAPIPIPLPTMHHDTTSRAPLAGHMSVIPVPNRTIEVVGNLLATITRASVKTEVEINLELVSTQFQKISEFHDLLISSASPDSLHAAYEALPAECKEKLQYWVWYMHGSPKQLGYAEKTIHENVYVLVDVKTPLIFARGTNLVEQLRNSLEEQKNILTTQRILEVFQEIQDLSNGHCSNEMLLRSLHKLPPHIQTDLQTDIARSFPGENARDKLESNVALLTTLTADTGVSLLQNAVTWHRGNLFAQQGVQKTNQKNQFIALVESNLLTHKELKKIYKTLAPDVKAAADFPKPPYFGKGLRSDLYNSLGAHPTAEGTMFRVYAPNAQKMEVAIRYNERDIRLLPMTKNMGGIWELNAAGEAPGTHYQYVVTTQSGEVLRKSDPYAFANAECGTKPPESIASGSRNTLGAHPTSEGTMFRVYGPKMQNVKVAIRYGNADLRVLPMTKNADGVWELHAIGERAGTYYQYVVTTPIGEETRRADPYGFIDLECGATQYESVVSDLSNTLGAHPTATGTFFRAYAPRAQRMEVAIRYNEGDVRRLPMIKKDDGTWELNADGEMAGTHYQYIITTADGKEIRKSDPCSMTNAKSIGVIPEVIHESIVANLDSYTWNDGAWIAKRTAEAAAGTAIEPNIYEVHIASWRRSAEGKPLNFRELADQLAAYCKEMHYTHVELMGLLDHPHEVSWGYQPTGYFSPNFRLGSPQDFQYLVDKLHQEGIGVFIDWVPGHFSVDDFALAKFDGTPLYQPGERANEWGSYMFDFNEKSVRDFLHSSAQFWMDKMHVDGIRIDAVNQTLYAHGSLHSEVATFYRDLSANLHKKFPGFVMSAEETAGIQGCTGSILEKRFNQKWQAGPTGAPKLSRGFGFDYKWAFAWMDSLLRKFIPKDFSHRSEEHVHLSGAVKSEGNEHVIRNLSHDEFANGKHSILDIMPGATPEERYSGVRLLLSQMMCMPGGKLTFMGSELAQFEEWSWRQKDVIDGHRPGTTAAVQWEVLEGGRFHSGHRGVHNMVKAVNKLHLDHPALSRGGNTGEDFKWVDGSDTTNNVVSYHRRSKDNSEQLLCLHNFSNHSFEEYTIVFPDFSYSPEIERLASLTEIFNSDDAAFGGSGKTNAGREISVFRNATGQVCCKVRLAPLATMVLQERFRA